MTPAISQGIVGAQVFLLATTILLSFSARGRMPGMVCAWLSSVLALVAGGLAIAAVVPGNPASLLGSDATFITYAFVAVIATLLNWGGVRLIAQYRAVRHARRLDSPPVRGRAADELREILRSEGVELDARLRQAEHDREQFLYALEERHARQIAGLAQEYQHEAHTILRQLLDQLAAEQLQPMVEQRLAEHQRTIESELGAIDSAAAGETLTTLRNDLNDLLAKVAEAEQRVATARAENPDTTMEEHVAARLEAIDEEVADRVEQVTARFDAALAETMAAVEVRIAAVGAELDERIDTASNPLAQRMVDTQAQVEQRLQEYLAVLGTRFSETEEILNARIIEQEQALEGRVIEIEQAVDARLAAHSTTVDQVLAEHDSQLQTALAEQSAAIGTHFSAERDRLIAELTEQAVTMQERVAVEFATAEQQARETVEATQRAWNRFTEELEERFATSREEALRAAREIAAAERDELERTLTGLTEAMRSGINEQVETLGREAAWQRAQVERTVHETTDRVQQVASEALANADSIFAELDRIGGERVDTIRRQAEDALVQSHDYVQQLQESLGAHLDALRERSGGLADEMNERLAAITSASQHAAQHIESYSREILETTGRELSAISEQQVHAIQDRISGDLTNRIQTNLNEQQRLYEQHLGEIAQRIVQQVNGDLAGLAEHARAAVTGEIEQVIVQARDHARQQQEQGFMQVMNELARQQAELSEQAHTVTDAARRMMDEGIRDNRRQLEEAMASMGAHMREELVRFHDEGQRRVATIIEQLRSREHEMLREEDRRLSQARGELVRQHQGALERQVRDMVGGLTGTIGSPAAAPAAPGIAQQHQAAFTAGIDRPATPLAGSFDPAAGHGAQAPAGHPFA